MIFNLKETGMTKRKVFGIKIVFQNEETKNTIIINGIVTELLTSLLNNDFINIRLEKCLINKPKEPEFESNIFKKFLIFCLIFSLLLLVA